MNRFIKIGEAASLLGISIQTLRRWERKKKVIPRQRSAGGTRYYLREELLGIKPVESDLTLAYARVSSHDQKKDLKTQIERLSSYCAAKGWSYEVISDEEELAKDVLEIITVFSARLYGARSRKNKQLIEAAKILINE